MHAHAAQREVLSGVHVGVGYVDAPVEGIWPAKDDIVAVLLERGCHVADALKPHQVNEALTVGEVRHEPRLAPLPRLLHAHDAPSQLHKWHVGSEFAHTVEPAAVDVLIGKGV